MNADLNALRQDINRFYRLDETVKVDALLTQLSLTDAEHAAIAKETVTLIDTVRRHPGERTLLEDFMQRYALSTDEGIALMGLAESLMRIPDHATADALIIDKITHGHWDAAQPVDNKILTTLSGWGLAVSDYVLQASDNHVFGCLVKRMGTPLIRQAVMQAVKLLGGQFVAGRDLPEALVNSNKGDAKDYLFSFDMLGEGARTDLKAKDYYNHYIHAIETLGTAQANDTRPLFAKDGISVKLSALHPRYEEAQKDNCLPAMIKRVRELAKLAKQYNVLLTLDAEEADRLELSLDIFAAVFTHADLQDFNGFGLAVQAYQKRCQPALDWLIALAHQQQKIIPIRLVKGAYWDSEIKRAQERGLSGYPVYTRKVNTDVSYLVAADKMLAANDAIYAQFATHNALTIAQIKHLANKHHNTHYEFQRLHGMGDPLYHALSAKNFQQEFGAAPPCRVYAPVGHYQDLLPYLVRRLLENGANSSFVNHIYDQRIAPESLIQNPLTIAARTADKSHMSIPLPQYLFHDRLNSVSYDLSDRDDQNHLIQILEYYKTHNWIAGGQTDSKQMRAIHNPADPVHIVGHVKDILPDEIDGMMHTLATAFPAWNHRPLAERAVILNKIADALAKHCDELIAICTYEAGKTIPDAVAEVREAIDFCRYYAVQARQTLNPITLPGPAGETNILRHEGRGVWMCISPWNFPLAIFVGQVVAALVAGNCVAAKPAPQTCLIAARAVALMHEAGVPHNVLQVMTGGNDTGAAITAHPSVAGIAFTGSTQTAWRIQKTLADKQGPLIPFIAETGGQNVMIVDSSALPEQVVDDIIRSGFQSTGQRCSALRVLYIQEEIAPAVLNMLRGAMAELRLGNPAHFSTDVGPVIDEAAKQRLNAHLHGSDMPMMQAHAAPANGYFVTPTVLNIKSIADLAAEHFGPIVHVVQFASDKKDKIIHEINAYGYGLTLGIHSRIESFIDQVVQQARVGNIYVNRGMTGAVVGVQPFGGMGLSGTGPKAGGPHYLQRFTTEKTVTINTTAVGGNTVLANLADLS